MSEDSRPALDRHSLIQQIRELATQGYATFVGYDYRPALERLETELNGAVIARPNRDERVSVYLRIGDWPARGHGFG